MSESKPHVCFISPYIYGYLVPGSDESIGGAERQQYILAQRLNESGYKSSFITFQRPGTKKEVIDGITVWKTLPRTNNIQNIHNVMRRLWTSIKRVGADIYYVRGNPPLFMLSTLCCNALGEDLIYCIANDSNIIEERLGRHHNMLDNSIVKKLYFRAIGSASKVVTQTNFQQEVLRENHGIGSVLIPNAYSLPPDKEIEPIGSREYMLWVGSLDRNQKKPERLLKLANELSSIDFVMIGSTEDKQYYNKIETSAEEIPNLNFKGFVPPDEVSEYYKKSIALINTSDYEGFPNTFLEAWRFAVPVLSLYYELDDVLENERIGKHAGSMNALKKHIKEFDTERSKSFRFGLNGREYLWENYSIEECYKKYDQLFTEGI